MDENIFEIQVQSHLSGDLRVKSSSKVGELQQGILSKHFDMNEKCEDPESEMTLDRGFDIYNR